jgi:hypothetical protein
MMSVAIALLGVFPVSFFAYVLSERVAVTHQARVGRAISMRLFFIQHWLDFLSDIKRVPSRRAWLIYSVQLSAAAVLAVPVEGLFYLYLMVCWLLVVLTTEGALNVFDRVSSDRSQMRILLGSLIAFLCVFAASIPQTSFDVLSWGFRWEQFLFFIPFQIAGMMIFAEAPFFSLNGRVYWLRSARFFVWSLVTAQLFLGGNLLGLDLYVKGAGLYVFFRLVGQYFPKYAQEDWTRVALLYLIPLTFFLFLGVALIHV